MKTETKVKCIQIAVKLTVYKIFQSRNRIAWQSINFKVAFEYIEREGEQKIMKD